MIYRGFTIEQGADGRWWWKKDALEHGPWTSEEDAMEAIDNYKRQQFQTASASDKEQV